MSFMQTLVNSLSGSGTNIIIYLAIIIVFLAGLCLCVVPVMRTRSQLRRGAKRMHKKDTEETWQNELFLGKGILLEQWSAYLKNLRFSDGVYHSAASVEDYINEETVIYGPGRAALSDAMPGLLTSIGFLGTLIGLSQGLSGFDMTNANTAQQSIMVLIPGMRFAFLTSIFGVIGSVVFTLITRAVYGSAEHAIRAFYASLNRHVGVRSVDALTQMATYQQEQTDILRTMAMDVNGRLTDNLRGIITESMEPMLAAMDNFIIVSTKEQMRFLDTIVARFVERMNESMGGQMSALGVSIRNCMQVQEDAMRALQDGMSDTKDYMRDVRDMRSLTDEMGRSLRNYMDAMTDSRRATEDNLRAINGSVEKMDAVAREQSRYLKNLSQMNEDVVRCVDRMNNVVGSVCERISDENEASAQTLRNAVNTMKETAANLSQLQKQSLRVIEAELNSIMGEYRAYADSFADSMKLMTDSVSSSVHDLPASVQETCESFRATIDRMGHTLTDAQKALDDAVDKMYAHK